MTNPLHAAYYADQAVQQSVEISENVKLAKDIKAARARGEETGLTDEEIAFYDAARRERERAAGDG